MKQILYVAPLEHLDRFDAFWKTQYANVEKRQAENIPYLPTWIRADRSLPAQNYIIFDVGNLEAENAWTVSSILSTVQLLRKLSPAKLIFIGKPCDELTRLYGPLARVHHCQTNLFDSGRNLEDDLLKALNGQMESPGNYAENVMAENLLASKEAIGMKLSVPRNFALYINVAGSQSRVGTTTQVFGIYHYLRQLGFKPAVIDRSGDLMETLEMYFNIDPQSHSINGICFADQESDAYNAFIGDCGVLSKNNINIFNAASISCLVGCTKPWELPYFSSALGLFREAPNDHLVALASFSTEADFAQLQKNRNGQGRQMMSAKIGYHPDLWAPPETYLPYDRILKAEIQRLMANFEADEEEMDEEEMGHGL